MNYTEKMIDVLAANERFVESLSFSQIDSLMKEFDSFSVSEHTDLYSGCTFSDYITTIYSKLELFKIFEEDRKSITIENDLKKDLVEGPFLFIFKDEIAIKV